MKKLCLPTLVVLLFCACGNNSNRANILPPHVQYMADTMYSHNRRAIEKELDSLCMQKSESIIAVKRDSLVTLQENMIKKITGEK